MATQNQHYIKRGGKSPLVKVLEILKNFFQEVFKQGSGQSPEVLLFLSGSEEKRQAAAQIPLDGIWLGAAGIRST